MGLAEVIPLENAAPHDGEMPEAVVKSAGRALQILEFFDEVQREACVTEICRSLRYPQSSTSVLLRSLVAMGYLQRDRYKRTYFPTRRVSLLGNWVDPALVQHGALLDIAEELARASLQTVVMATANGLHAQYIYKFRSGLASGEAQSLSIGTLRPIASTAVGRALLSSYDDNHVAKVLRRINAERPADANAISVSEFLADLKSSRRRRYFSGAGAGPRQGGIAATLQSDRQMLVIGIEGDLDTILGLEETLSPLLLKAAAQHSGRKTLLSA